MKKTWIMFILLLLVTSVLFSSCAVPEPVEDTEMVVLEETATLAPTATEAPTNTPAPTETPLPTETPTPTLTSTVTPTPEPVMIDDGRRWNEREFLAFMSYVANHILADPRYPNDDEIIHSIEPFTFMKCYEGAEYCDTYVYDMYSKQDLVTPLYWCEWVYFNLSRGYGTNLLLDGNTFEARSLEDAWEQTNLIIGTEGREPFCPQFKQ